MNIDCYLLNCGTVPCIVFVLLYPHDLFVPKQGVGLICHDLKYGLYSIHTVVLGGGEDDDDGDCDTVVVDVTSLSFRKGLDNVMYGDKLTEATPLDVRGATGVNPV